MESMKLFNAKDFGAAIRFFRKRRGYTQQHLADYCGCSVMTISNLERGKEGAELGRALRILNTLSVDVDAVDRGEADSAHAGLS